MKKIIAQIITIVLILAIFAGSVNAASFGTTLVADKQSVKPGGEIELTFGVDAINIEGGITSVEGILDYDEEIFEPVVSGNVTSLNGWSTTYNDEDTELNGKFLSLKFSNGVTKAEQVFKIKLKVKAGIADQETVITIKDISSTDGGDMIPTANKSVMLTISKNAQDGDNQGGDNQGGDNQGGNNQGGDNQGGNNQGGDNQGGNNQGGNNQGGDNQGGNNQGGSNQGGSNNGNNNGGNGKDNTNYGSKLPQTGTNANLIIAIGVVVAIGIGSFIKYKSMK